jgi:large subunit ribosomal protein L20
MTRVKRGISARNSRRKLLKLNRSFSGVHSRLFRQAKQQRMKALRSAFVSRKELKREQRKLWIQRIQSGLRSYGFMNQQSIKYSVFINRLKKNQIILNRKVLSQLIIFDNDSFTKLVKLTEV